MRGGAAWELASGRQVDVSVPEPHTRFERDISSTFGLLTLVDANGTKLKLHPGPEDMLGVLAELPDGDLLAGGWFYDYDGVLIRFDLRRKKTRWRIELGRQVGGIALSPAGTHAVVSCGPQHHIVRCEDGRVLTTHTFEPARLAISTGGRMLAASSSCLRVWHASDTIDQSAPKGSAGLLDAQFSPSGTRLLSGSCVLNALTGEHIAELQLERPGYLEGGPAFGCTRMLDDGLIEAQVFRGVHRWDAQGKLLWRDDTRRYRLTDSLAWAPDGESYALHSRSVEGVVEIRRARTGELLSTLRVDATRFSKLAYSLDGERLAMRFHPMGAPPRQQHEILWSTQTWEQLARRGAGEGWPDDLHGWQGFVGRHHDLVGEYADGFFSIRRHGELIARAPCDEPLVASPDGTRWGGRHELFVLE